MKNIHTLITLIVVVILSSMTTANAVFITDSDSYGPIDVGSAAGWAGVSLPKFDSLLGILTQVTLTLDANTFAGKIGWDNESSAASNVTLGIGAEVTINAFGSLGVTAIPMQTGSSSVTADTDWAANYVCSDSFWVKGGSGSDSNANSSTDPAVLTLFTGAGATFDVWLSSCVSTSVEATNGGFGPSIITAGDTDGTITVTYEYAPAPEPATIALLGLGSMALRRKRRL